MVCKICNLEFEKLPSFIQHIRIHNITSLQYYNKYLKKDNDGVCVVCKNPTNFINFTKGYREFCSHSCCNKYINQQPETRAKIKQTLKEKYGDENYVNVEKGRETKLERHGFEYFPTSDKFRKLSDEEEKNRVDKIKVGVHNFYNNAGFIFLSERIKEKNLPLKIVKYTPKHYKLMCLKCNKEFDILYQTFYLRNKIGDDICIYCNPLYGEPISFKEKQLLTFIQNNYNEKILENDKSIIYPYELDIYLPDLKLAFEFNGIFWHSELNKENNYHLLKTESCEKQGIHLIHIYEDDWMYKQDIIKSRILNLLGKSDIAYARDCEISEVDYYKEFLEDNHNQGYISCKIALGLYWCGELVALMTFGGLRKNLGQTAKEGSWELLRFCNKLNTSVVGGANKLFKYFIDKYHPEEVISYADRSWTMNNPNTLYNKLEFNFDSKTQPNYYYIVGDIRENRFKYRKSELIKEGYDPNMSEHEIMLEREIYRIYDSGQLKYVWRNKK